MASYGCACGILVDLPWDIIPSSSPGQALVLALTWKQFGAFSRWHQVLEADKQALAATMGLIAVVSQKSSLASVLKDDTQYTLEMLRWC